jgi:signal transduction histidine kinase
MLHEFLLTEQKNILALCAKNLSDSDDSRDSKELTEIGLPIFYNELIEVLRADKERSEKPTTHTKGLHHDSAARCGKESFRLGYTISQVVQGYGMLCQAITNHAEDQHTPILTREFNRLNFCLDVAIAQAVTEFSRAQRSSLVADEAQRLGSIAYEMRNALCKVATSHQLIRKGLIGYGGDTNQVLEDAITEMQNIINGPLLEARLQKGFVVDLLKCRLIDIVSTVEVIAIFPANVRSIKLSIDVSPDLIVEVDHHLVVSAMSDLVQNAINSTRFNGNVWVRAKAAADRVLIEIEDQCGGISEIKLEELLAALNQNGEDLSSVSEHRLSTSERISLTDGRISLRNIPGNGCVFTIDLPQASVTAGKSNGVLIPIQ